MINHMPLTKRDIKAIAGSLEPKFKEQRKAFDTHLEDRLKEQRKAINGDLADLISRSILPQIDGLSEELQKNSSVLDRIERKLNNQQDSFDEYSKRIEKLERIHPGGKHQAQI